MKPSIAKVILILGLGILAISTASIWSRLAFEAAGMREVGFSLVLAASRLTLASLILVPTWRYIPRSPDWKKALPYAIAAGVFLGIHFACWISSLAYTSIAASTALVTTNPVWVALISWVWLKEKISRKTITGIAIALTGGLIIGLADSGNHAGSNPLLGNFLALAGSWAVSFYLLLGREAQKRGLTVNSYGAIAYTTAAIVLLPMPILFGSSYSGYPTPVYLYILLMALLPQLVGHTSFNWAMRWLSPTLVTLSILFEPAIASFLGYLVFREIPPPFVFAGAVVLLTGVGIAAMGERRSRV